MTVCLPCRHGEAEHNTASEWTLRDPSLTMHGRRQARAARATLADQGVLGIDEAARAQLVVASPLRRTLQTAEILCAGVVLPILAHPDIQETSQAACDTGHPPAVLQSEFPAVAMGLVPDGWHDKLIQFL